MAEDCQSIYMDNKDIIIDCKNLLEKVIQNKPSREISVEIGEFFTRNITILPRNTLEQLVLNFLSGIEKEPLYVNEIKQYLNNENPLLYKKYGSLFSNNHGVWKVFGIEIADDACCPIIDKMLEENSSAEIKDNREANEIINRMREKRHRLNKEKRRKRNAIRKNSKEIAIKAFKKRHEKNK